MKKKTSAYGNKTKQKNTIAKLYWQGKGSIRASKSHYDAYKKEGGKSSFVAITKDK